MPHKHRASVSCMSSCRRTRGFSPFLCAECSYLSFVPPFSSRARTSSTVRISGAILAHRAGRTAYAHARGAFLPTSYKHRQHGKCMHHARVRVRCYSHTLAVRASRDGARGCFPVRLGCKAARAAASAPRRSRRLPLQRTPSPASCAAVRVLRRRLRVLTSGEAPTMSAIKPPYGMDPTTHQRQPTR